MDKFKSEFYTFITPKGFSVMRVLTENLLKLLETLKNEATFHNLQHSVTQQVPSSLNIHE